MEEGAILIALPCVPLQIEEVKCNFTFFSSSPLALSSPSSLQHLLPPTFSVIVAVASTSSVSVAVVFRLHRLNIKKKIFWIV